MSSILLPLFVLAFFRPAARHQTWCCLAIPPEHRFWHHNPGDSWLSIALPSMFLIICWKGDCENDLGDALGEWLLKTAVSYGRFLRFCVYWKAEEYERIVLKPLHALHRSRGFSLLDLWAWKWLVIDIHHQFDKTPTIHIVSNSNKLICQTVASETKIWRQQVRGHAHEKMRNG